MNSRWTTRPPRGDQRDGGDPNTDGKMDPEDTEAGIPQRRDPNAEDTAGFVYTEGDAAGEARIEAYQGKRCLIGFPHTLLTDEAKEVLLQRVGGNPYVLLRDPNDPCASPYFAVGHGWAGRMVNPLPEGHQAHSEYSEYFLVSGVTFNNDAARELAKRLTIFDGFVAAVKVSATEPLQLRPEHLSPLGIKRTGSHVLRTLVDVQMAAGTTTSQALLWHEHLRDAEHMVPFGYASQ